MATAQERLNERMRALIDAVRPLGLPKETGDLAEEMVAANESPIALNMLSEVLADRAAMLPPEVVEEFEALASDLGLTQETAARHRR